MGEIEIKCDTPIVMVPVSDLKAIFNEWNSNEHGEDQIIELVEQFKYQGVRVPAIVGIRDGVHKLQAGHGRVLAAERAGMTHYPCQFQEWDSEGKQFAFVHADNFSNRLSTLSLPKIHLHLPNIEPFPIERLAIPNFQFEPQAGEANESARPTLADRFLVPPFSVLDARQGYWQDRKRQWLALGIKSELGRGGYDIRPGHNEGRMAYHNDPIVRQEKYNGK